MKTFITGSAAFFSNIEGFHPNNIDIISFYDSEKQKNRVHILMKNGSKYYNYVKSTYMTELYQCMMRGRKICYMASILIPEICEYLNITLNDISRFEMFRNDCDDKYQYLWKIYDFYKLNGKMELTNEQLQEAYEMYKEERNE